MKVTPKREKRGIKVESKSGIGSDFGPSLISLIWMFVLMMVQIKIIVISKWHDY